jgi:serine phosphatase RsbU (regulator of sigma subunit)
MTADERHAGAEEVAMRLDVDRMLIAAIEAAPLGIGVLDRDLRLLRANLALGSALDADLLRPHAVEALARAVSLRMSDGAEPDAEGPWQVRLFPLGAGDDGVGVLVDNVGEVLEAERRALSGVTDARILAQETVDALTTGLAILDEDGRIIMVNRAWRDFGAGNDPAQRDFVGESYLAACAAAAPGSEGAEDARAFADGLRDLIAGGRTRLELEYPCHSPTEQRWFMARAARFESAGAMRIVVTHENVTARRRSEDRHRHIAATLQRSLLPQVLPEPRGLELAARYRAQGEGLEVGGDFYDVFADGDDWLLVIGDVCGKGPEAAAVTAEARWTIRALAEASPGPARLLEAVNRALVGRRRDFTFLSAIVARVSVGAGATRVTFARAGHPHPLVLRAGGAVEQIATGGGLLGLFEDARFGEGALELGPGDALVLHTDGVTEARRDGVELGADGTREALAAMAGATAADLARGLEDEVMRFSAGRPRDDVAIVVVRVAPRPSAAVS